MVQQGRYSQPIYTHIPCAQTGNQITSFIPSLTVHRVMGHGSRCDHDSQQCHRGRKKTDCHDGSSGTHHGGGGGDPRYEVRAICHSYVFAPTATQDSFRNKLVVTCSLLETFTNIAKNLRLQYHVHHDTYTTISNHSRLHKLQKSNTFAFIDDASPVALYYVQQCTCSL